MFLRRNNLVCLALVLLSPLAFSRAVKQTAKTKGQIVPAVKDKQEAIPIPQSLTRGEATRFPLPAATAVSAWNYCDQEGDVYLLYASAKPRIGLGPMITPSVAGQPITKLSPDSQGVTTFSPGHLSGYQSLVLGAFSVDRHGDVYGLYQAQPSSLTAGSNQEEQSVIVKYDSDGSVDSVARTHNPPSGVFDPAHFVAFSDGNLLVTGILYPPRPQPSASHPLRQKIVHHALPGSRPFTGIFDQHGHFLKEIKLPGDVSPEVPAKVSSNNKPGETRSNSPSPQKGKNVARRKPFVTPPGMRWVLAMLSSLTVAGPEDTAYLLRPSNPPILYTLSSYGQVIAETHLHAPPTGHMHPINMSLAGRSDLLINFSGEVVGKKGYPESVRIFELVNPSTGKVIADYRLPKGAGAMPACAAGPNDFLFLGSTKDGKLEIVSYHGD